MAYDDLTSLKSKGTYFWFQSTINKTEVILKAFVKSIQDQYSAEWAEEKVHGRMDPIPTYSGTTRRVSFSLEIVAGSFEEAASNLQKVSTLIQSMYPSYEKNMGALGMKQVPLMKVKYANLIQNAAGKGSKALLGYVPSIAFEPNFDDLLFYDKNGNVYPKLIDLNFEMGVIHEHQLSANDAKFPYIAGSKTAQNKFVSYPDSEAASKYSEDELRGVSADSGNETETNSADIDDFSEEDKRRLRGLKEITGE